MARPALGRPGPLARSLSEASVLLSSGRSSTSSGRRSSPSRQRCDREIGARVGRRRDLGRGDGAGSGRWPPQPRGASSGPRPPWRQVDRRSRPGPHPGRTPLGQQPPPRSRLEPRPVRPDRAAVLSSSAGAALSGRPALTPAGSGRLPVIAPATHWLRGRRVEVAGADLRSPG
jgi:hypothetical protein